MPLFHVVVLAVVQGLTEFLPISSTAHLYLTSWILEWQAQELTFDIMLHLGTLFAVLLYFGREWVQIIGQGFGLKTGGHAEIGRNRSLLWLIALGTLPVVIVGLAFNDMAETTWRNPFVMGVMLIVVGVLMWIADNSRRKQRTIGTVGLADALIIGAAQALAIVPGCSRSGITITAGLFRNLDREAAARYSFLLSTPAIGGATVMAFKDLYEHNLLGSLLSAPFLLGVAVSTITGCAVIAWFLRYLRNSGLRPFVYYRVIFGIIVLALAIIRRPA